MTKYVLKEKRMSRRDPKYNYVRRCLDGVFHRRMSEADAKRENNALDCLGKLTDPARWEKA